VPTSRRREPLAAIVLAAGKGTRMKSRRPKVLHEVCGRPLTYFPVKRALELGADPVVVVVGHQAEAVEAALSAALPEAPLRFAVQEQQLGTAHAVMAARKELKGFQGAVLILSGDTPLLTTETLRAVVEAKGKTDAGLAFATMHLDNPSGYGRLVRAPDGGPALIVEDRDATPDERRIQEVNAGLYCADSAFLWKTLARVDSRNAQKEFYLTDIVAIAARGPGAASTHVPYVEAAGVNDQEELSLAARALTRRIGQDLMRAGVTIEDPERFDCDEGVTVGPDTILEPSVRLRGRTTVGAGCVIGQGSILTHTTVADGATVNPYTVANEAVIGAGAIVGPFSRLRPGAELGEGVHVGNFVELKKTRMGKGAKANHLTYLGDAVIGAGTNVGCGTITCNYDGEKKHPTIIGERAFIGSDSILVAPITVGDGAYVAAGSTLTESVPAGALALGRARQVTKEGWVAARDAARREAAEPVRAPVKRDESAADDQAPGPASARRAAGRRYK
jgi:bifunctional UDP-N-acetylglucosamine pyrophosphorylase / glucosamine-1-phosphate N-acetyltransferase